MQAVVDTLDSSLAGWTLGKINLVRERDELSSTVEHIKIKLAAVCEQASGQVGFQVEFYAAQDSWDCFKVH